MRAISISILICFATIVGEGPLALFLPFRRCGPTIGVVARVAILRDERIGHFEFVKRLDLALVVGHPLGESGGPGPEARLSPPNLRQPTAYPPFGARPRDQG